MSTLAVAVVALLGLVALALAGAGPAGAASAAGTVKLTPAAFSPNGDTVRDRLTVRVKLKRKASLTVGVYAPNGKLVATLQRQKSVQAGTRTYRWSGRSGGEPLTNGRYEVRAKVKAGKRTSTIRRTATLDGAAPRVDLTADLQPTLFAGAGHTVKLPYVVSERGVVLSLQIRRLVETQGPTGKVLATRALGKARTTAGTATWNGRRTTASILGTGKYSVVLRATDAAGNTGVSSSLPVTLFAPTTVRGKVVDKNGRPVKGASVLALPAGVSGTTASNGSFVLHGCPLGRTVLKAGKRGLPTGGLGASIDLRPRTWTVVLGHVPEGKQAHAALGAHGWDWKDTWDDALDEVDGWFDSVTIRMSGSFAYADRNGNSTPMRNVKIVLRDVWLDLGGQEGTRDLVTSATDAQGDFDFTYTVTWDDIDTPDVRVWALAEDKDGVEARVEYPTFLGDVIGVPGEYWEDNESDRLDRGYIMNEGRERAAWHALDVVRECRAAGFTRPQILIVYPYRNPIDSSSGGGYKIDKIRLVEDYEWGATPYHEYGHAWLRSAYAAGEDVAGIDCNAFDAYYDDPGLPDFDEFWLDDGTFVGEKSDLQYTGFETEEEPWTAFAEGWAEFFAGRVMGCDYAGSSQELFECDRQHAGKDENSIIHSVSRLFWDLYDSTDSRLVYSWEPQDGPNKIGPRLASYYGSGDDDRVDGPVAGTDVFSVVKQVLDDSWPSDAWELRSKLRERLAGNSQALRAVDAIYYRMGFTDGITENRPHVDAGTVLVDGDANNGGYRGTLHLWCRVTDPDAPGGDTDMDHMQVRFEGRCAAAGQALSEWQPMAWTATRSATPPPGQSGDDWFRVDFDTLELSPVMLVPDHVGGVYTWNSQRAANTVTGATTGGTMRRDRYQVQAIAYDGLAESDPVESAEFVVDNGTSDFGGHGIADSHFDYIYWETMDDIRSSNYTYELRFTPSAIQAGTLLMYTLGYWDGGSWTGRAALMKLEMLADGRVSFAINEHGNWPGKGTWHSVVSSTALQVGHTYHIAAEDGATGLRLYLDGHLAASDPSYTALPQADWGDAIWVGGFSLGDYEDYTATDTTALGTYDELRTSKVLRYAGDFTPPSGPFGSDASTVILDHLDGGTNGTNQGCTFGP